ncbi:hypothetical protein RM780_19320 [Streptomyces sp. DSM 44917]|uniref:Uncharacterized protein n=1 Tax=Streptomyces boetiae TaxID=3075541 RepID=A0ABU2LBY7_9ACTN|nr:hypothetical protein [Streptomyces sp. DSM 44917]MDT0309095.1 hypothetical protein [Streptomyces sp. DSM 44917]
MGRGTARTILGTGSTARGRAALLALVLALAAALMVPAAPRAAAAADGGRCVPALRADTAPGLSRLLELADRMRAEGHDRAAIDRFLAERACLTRVSAPLSAGTTAQTVSVAAPDVYRIGVVDGRARYVSIMDWRFAAAPGYPMRGRQAVTTWFSAGIRPILPVVHFSGLTPQFPSLSREDATDLNANGLAFLLTPQQTATDANVAAGSLALVFEAVGTTCTGFTARGIFAHTWNATDITDVTVSAGWPAFAWTTYTDRSVAFSPSVPVSGVCP